MQEVAKKVLQLLTRFIFDAKYISGSKEPKTRSADMKVILYPMTLRNHVVYYFDKSGNDVCALTTREDAFFMPKHISLLEFKELSEELSSRLERKHSKQADVADSLIASKLGFALFAKPEKKPKRMILHSIEGRRYRMFHEANCRPYRYSYDRLISPPKPIDPDFLAETYCVLDAVIDMFLEGRLSMYFLTRATAFGEACRTLFYACEHPAIRQENPHVCWAEVDAEKPMLDKQKLLEIVELTFAKNNGFDVFTRG